MNLPNSAFTRRQLLTGVTGVGLGMALSGCAKIPTSSAVHEVPAVNGYGGTVPYLQPRPPAPGASPEQIILGFMQAGVGFEKNFEVAREFLTPTQSATWDPSAKVTIYSSQQDISVSPPFDDGYRAALTSLGSLTRLGEYTRNSADIPTNAKFKLVKTGSEWRLSEVPDGIFISDSVFPLLYQTIAIYFVDNSGRFLVPDVRYVPTQRAASTAMELLQQGPTSGLQHAVRNEAANALTYRSNDVRIDDAGTAHLEMADGMVKLDAKLYTEIMSQVVTTLQTIPSVGRVRVLSGIDTFASDSLTKRLPRPMPGHHPALASNHGIISPIDSNPSQASQIVPALAGKEVRGIRIKNNSQYACALTSNRESLLIITGASVNDVKEIPLGQEMVQPMLDPFNFVITTTRNTAGVFIVQGIDTKPSVEQLDAQWLQGREVLSLSLAPDGVRMLVCSRGNGDDMQVVLVAIIRDEKGMPTGLGDPQNLWTGFARTLHATWYSDTIMLVLGEQLSSKKREAHLVTLGNEETLLPIPPLDTVALGGSSVANLILAQSKNGSIYRAGHSGWSPLYTQGYELDFY